MPIGVWLGLRPIWARRAQPLAQFLAAFPANLLFPPFVIFIVHFHLNPDIWLTPLMILGTQWYILFNVIAGAAAFPGDLREAAEQLPRRRLAVVAQGDDAGHLPLLRHRRDHRSGGAWNAAIVAEVASWGDTKLTAHGLGAYIAEATEHGDMAARRAGHGGDVGLRAAVQPPAVAAAVCLCRTTPEARLKERLAMDTVVDPADAARGQGLQAGLPQGRQRRSAWCSTTST